MSDLRAALNRLRGYPMTVFVGGQPSDTVRWVSDPNGAYVGAEDAWDLIVQAVSVPVAVSEVEAAWSCDWTPDDLNPGPECPYCEGQMCARFDGLGCTHDRIERHGYPEGYDHAPAIRDTAPALDDAWLAGHRATTDTPVLDAERYAAEELQRQPITLAKVRAVEAARDTAPALDAERLATALIAVKWWAYEDGPLDTGRLARGLAAALSESRS